MNSRWIEYLPDWYLQWCWENEELQAWWVTTWPSTTDTVQDSNINVGDRFTLGMSRQACVIASKTFHVGVDTANRQSPEWIEYSIGGDTGGFRGRHYHDDDGYGLLGSAKAYARFIPTAEQLQRLGYGHIAQRLLADPAIIANIGCRCLMEYRERAGHHATGCPLYVTAEAS